MNYLRPSPFTEKANDEDYVRKLKLNISDHWDAKLSGELQTGLK